METENEYTFKTPKDCGTFTGSFILSDGEKVLMIHHAADDDEEEWTEVRKEKELIIKRVQFTAYDRFLYPEIDNDEYLEHELVETGLASQVCSYGWIEIDPVNDGFKWIKKADIPIGE